MEAAVLLQNVCFGCFGVDFSSCTQIICKKYGNVRLSTTRIQLKWFISDLTIICEHIQILRLPIRWFKACPRRFLFSVNIRRLIFFLEFPRVIIQVESQRYHLIFQHCWINSSSPFYTHHHQLSPISCPAAGLQPLTLRTCVGIFPPLPHLANWLDLTVQCVDIVNKLTNLILIKLSLLFN